jgi:hypothetical protein
MAFWAKKKCVYGALMAYLCALFVSKFRGFGVFGCGCLFAHLEDPLIPVCIFQHNSLQSLAGKFWAIVIPPMAQKTRHEWGTFLLLVQA